MPCQRRMNPILCDVAARYGSYCRKRNKSIQQLERCAGEEKLYRAKDSDSGTIFLFLKKKQKCLALGRILSEANCFD